VDILPVMNLVVYDVAVVLVASPFLNDVVVYYHIPVASDSERKHDDDDVVVVPLSSF
jgi:hypothetical protein